MKQFYRLLLLCMVLTLAGVDHVFAQCSYDPGSTVVTVDLSAKADTVWSITNLSRNGNACTGSNCITFVVTVHPDATEVGFDVQNPAPNGASARYQLNCGPQTSLGTPLCINGLTTFCITFCKPGNDQPTYTISVSRGFAATNDRAIRVGGTCTNLMAIQGLTKSTITWTSIAPGTAGQYNSYLSCTSACDSTYVTPTAVAPGNPSYIDYKVCGTRNGCVTGSKCDTIRIYTYPALTVATSPASPTICTGGPTSVQITATPSGGNPSPSYTYSWTGPGGFTSTAQAPTVNTAGTYTVSVYDSTDCSPVTQTITVSSATTPSITSSATGSVCSGTAQSYAITSSVVGTTYNWSRAAVAGISNGAVSNQTASTITETLVNTTNSPINVVYQITPSANGCVGSVFTYTVTVNPTPVVTTANTAAICSNTATNIALTATTASTFTWTVGTITGSISGASAGSGSTLSQTLLNPSNTTAGTVQYLVTPTSTATPACPGSPYTITVTVNPTPVVTTANTAAICNNTATNIALTSTATSTFTWTIGTVSGGITGATAGSGSTIPQTLTNPSNASAGTVQYLVTPTSTASTTCAGAAYPITVTVNPTPAVTTPNTATICSGGTTSIALTASAASSFTWTVGIITGSITGATGGSGSTIAQTLTNPSNAAAGTVQYIVTPTSTATTTCAGSPYTITVTVNPKPVVTTANTAAICSNTSTNIALTASATSTFSWTVGTITGSITGASAGSGSTISQTLINPSNATAGTVQYIVTPTSTASPACPGTPYTITVTVNPTPVVTTANTATICNNTATNIALTATAASTFTWTIGTITGGITGATAGSGATIAQTLSNPSSSSTGTVQYIVTPTSTASTTCAGTPYTITVTVNPTPVVTTPNTAVICSAGTTNIALTASAASTFTWTVGTITGSITGGSSGSGSTIAQTLTNPSNSAAGTLQYLVTPTSTATPACPGSPYTITVTVNPTPAVTTANMAAICSNTSTNIALTSSAPSTFSWTVGTITGSITGASAGTGNTIAQTLINPSNSAAGTVQYIVTPTSTATPACPGAPYTITVTVNPTPAVTTANTATICNNTATNIALTASAASTFTWTVGTITGSITGASGGSGAAIAQTLLNPSNTSTGSVQYIVTPTSTASTTCAGAPYTITVTVNPTPAVTTPNTATICSSTATNIALTASAASTFTWTVGTVSGGITGATAGSGATIAQTLTDPSNSTAGTVQYLVTPTSTATPACPGAAYTITVTVNPTPAVTTANTAAICSNTSTNIALTSSAPSTFSWTVGTITGSITGASAGSGSTISQTLINPSNTTAGTVQYIVTPTSTATPACPGAPYTITVTVNPTPAVTTANTATICNNTATNIALTASAASTFTWTLGTITGGITGANSGSGATIAQTLSNPSNASAGTVQYIVTPTSTASTTCAGTPYTITVTVNPTPVVTTPNTAAICSGGTTAIALTASAASTFTWTVGTITGSITGASAGSGTSIAQTLTNPSNAAAGTLQYIVTPTSTATPACPGSPYTITVTVNPTPAVTTANTAAICSNTSTNIALTSSAPSTFSWTVGTITGSITGASAGTGNTIAQTLINPSNSAAGTVQYIVTPTSTATPACPGSPYTITVTVNPTPAVTTANTATICNNTATNIALTASAASTFTWTVGTITGSITGASGGSGATIAQTLLNPSNTSAGSVQYIVTPTSTASTTCAGAPYTITVTVNPTPAVTTPNTATICSSTATNIALTASAASTFTWTVGTITGALTGASAGSGSTIAQTLTNPSNSAAGTVQYLVTPTSTATPACPGAVYTITVTVNPTPAVTTANTAAICSNTSTNIALTSSAPSTFSWTVGTITGSITGASAGSGSTISQTLINPSNTTAGTVQYIVTPTSTATPACPGAPYTITVTVNPTPAVTTANTATICNNTATNIALTASAASTFTWTLGTITGGITGANSGSGATIAQTLSNPGNASAGTVQYIVTPTSTASTTCAGAPYTITVTVNPTPAVTTPNTTAICNNTATNISLTASASSTFTWTIGTVSGGITGATAGGGSAIAQTLSNPSNASAGTVQYIVTPTSATTPACAGAPYTITVTVNPTPVITTANTAAICSNTSTNIALTASAPSTFTWTIGTITGGITGANAGSGSTIAQTLTNPGNTAAGTVQYIVTPTSTASTNCIGAPYTITVTVNPTPAVTTSSTAAICSNTTTNIALTSSAASTFAWTVGTITGGITGAGSGSGSTIAQTLINPGNASAGTVQYIVTPTSTASTTCGGAPYTITVTVNPIPTVTTANSASICSNTSTNISLNASTSSTFTWTIGSITGGITGASSGSGNAIAQTLVNPSNASPGTVQYIVTPTSTASTTCAGAPYTITVTVNPSPVVSTPSTAAICSGGTTNIALSATATSTFNWTIGTITGAITGATAGSGNTIAQTLTNPVTTGDGTVEYIVTPTSVASPTCSGAPYSIVVTVHPLPAVTNPAPGPICNGGSANILLTASVPSTFNWTIGTIVGGITGASGGSGNLINQVLNNPSAVTSGSVEYLVVPTSLNGCVGTTHSLIATVTVHPTPVVTTAATDAICDNTTTNITLTASTASTFSWNIGAITGGITGASAGSGNTIAQTLQNPSNSTAGTVEYIVVPTSIAGGCQGPAKIITVTVNPTPAVTTASSFAICNNTATNIALTASAPATFTWAIGNVGGGVTGATSGSGNSIAQTLINPSNSTAGTVEYIVTPTSTAGTTCGGAPYTITVTVNPTPAVTTATTFAICNNAATNIPLTASAPSTFTWTVGTVTGAITGANAGSGPNIAQTLVNPSNSAAGTVEYIVTPTSTAGTTCPGAPYSITVTVNPTPVVTTANSFAICNNTATNISLTASVTSTFTWTIGTITGGVTGATGGSGSTIAQTLTNPGNTAAGTVEYSVTPTSTAGTTCPGAPYTITVTVNPTPAVTTSSTATICNNTSTNISLTASTSSTYTWTIGTITGGITGATAGSGNTIAQTLTNPSNSTAGTVEYIVTPTSTASTSCPGAPYTITVTVNPTPAVSGVSNAFAICNNTATNIPLSATVPSSFTWTIGTVTGGITGATAGSGSTIAQTLTNPSNSAAGTVQYLITATSNTGSCPAASAYAVTVTVNPTPQVSGVPNAFAICNNTATNIPLSATVPSTYSWTIGTVTGGITGATAGSGSTIAQTLTNPSNSAAGTVQYLITATSTTGSCPAASAYSITVTVNPTPAVSGVPNAFAICNNTATNIPLSATVPSSFTWTIGTVTGGITGATAGSGATIAQTLTNPSNSAAGTVQYLITATSTTGSCPAASAYAVTVTVNPTPAVSGVPNAFAICNNTATNIPLSATVPSSFTWTIGTVTGGITGATAGSGSTIAQTLTNPSNSAAGTVQYLITATSTTGSCPAASAYAVTVTVNPTLQVSGVPNAFAICNNTATNIPLSATVPSTYSWTIGTVTGGITGATAGSGATIAQTLTNPSNSAAGTVQYLITATSTTGSCPAASAYAVTVTVNPTPAVSGVPNAFAICNNTATNIPLSATVPSSFTWTIGTVTGGITGATAGSGATIAQTLTNPSNSAAGTVEYLVSATSTTGTCPAASAYSITVTVNPTPQVSGVPSAVSICSNTATSIPLNATVPSTYTWTIGTVTGGITGATAGSGSTIAQTLTNPSNVAAGTVQYLVTATSTTGSCPAASTYTITVTVNPTPAVNTAATAAICSNTATNISLTATNASTFTWTTGAITGGITGASAGSGNTIAQTLTNPSNSTAGTVEYIVTPTSTASTSCPGAPYTITVTVNPTPQVSGVPNAFAICNNTATNIPLSATVPSSFTWTIGTVTGGITGATAGSGANIAQTLTNPSNSAAGTVQYLITATSTTGSCPAASAYAVTVTVNPTPAVSGVPNAFAICNNTATNIPLSATVPSLFTWTIGTVTGGITGATAGSGATIAQTLTNPSNSAAGTVQYLITATSTTGSCPAASAYAVTVTVNPTPQVSGVPSAFAICNNTATNIPLSATVPSSFTWTIGTVTGGITGATAGSGATIAQTLTNPSNSAAGTVQYLITATSTTGTCPAASAYAVTVTVNPTPQVSGVPNAFAICNNTATNIPLNATVPSSFTWTIGTVTGGITGSTAGSGATIAQTLTNPSNSAAGTVQYLITATSTTGSCPAASAYAVTVTVNPTPAVSGVPNAFAICNNTATNIPLSATVPSSFTWTIGTVTGGITGATAGSGATIAQTLTNPSNSAAGTVQYLITATSTTGSCPAASAYAVTVTVNPTPAVSGVPNAFAICNNTATNIPLSATVPSSFTWTIGTVTGGITGANAGSGATIAQTLTNPSNSAAGTVEYLVSATSTTGSCPAASAYAVTVTVNPTPQVSGVPNAFAICNNTATNIPLSATVPSSFTWTIGTVTGGITGATAGSGATIAQTLTNPSNSAAGTVEYLVSATSTTGSCPAASAYSITVTVNPTPAVSGVPNAFAICNNSATNIPLNATVPSSFTWTIGTVTGGITGATAGSGSTIAQTLTNPSNSAAGTVQYLITATSTTGSCPAASAYAVTVTVNPTPAVTTANNFTICNNTATNIPLTSTTGSTFNWTIGAITGGITGATSDSGATIAQTLVNPSNTSAGSVEYIVTPTSTASTTCGGAPYSIIVTVNPTPVINTTNTAEICSNTTTNIALTASVPATYTWTVGTVNGGITGASAGAGNTIAQTLVNPSSSTAGTVVYQVTATSTTGSCPAATAYPITVTVNPIPAMLTANNASICNNTATNIVLSASAASTFTWTIGNITGGVTGATAGSGNTISQILQNPSNSTTGTVEYVVTPTSTATTACAGAPYTITVNVNPTPVVTSANTATICNNTSTAIPLTASVPSTFTWTVGAITGNITGAAAGSGSNIAQTLLNPSDNVPGTVEYIVTPTSITGTCPGLGTPYSIVVTVNPTPATPVITTNSPICAGSTLNLSATTSIAGASFSWTGPNGFTSNQQNPSIANATLAANGNYTVIATSAGCSSAPQSSNVTVYPIPAPPAVFTNSPVCYNNPINLAASAVTGASYQWTGPNGFTSTQQNPVINNATLADAGVYNVTITVNGCTSPAAATNPVIVYPVVPAQPSSNSPVCTGTTLNLQAATVAGVTYSWSGPNGFTSNQQNPSIPNVSFANAGSYTLVLTQNGCPGPAVSTTVVVNQTPTVTSAATDDVCSNQAQSYQIAASVANSTFNWSRAAVPGISNPAVSNQTSAVISEALVNTTNAPINVTYLITATTPDGCSNPVAFQYIVTVKPTPVITSPATAITCSGATMVYNITSSVANTSYAWGRGTVPGITNAGIAGQTANPISEVLVNSTNVPIDVTYVITPLADGCAGAAFNYVVTVDPKPMVNSIAADTLCSNTNQNYLITSPVAGANFVWSRGAVAGISNPAVTNQTSNPITEALVNTTNTPVVVDYTIIPSANGCATGVPFTYSLTVNPVANVTSAASNTICNNTAQNYTLTSNVSGTTYTWSRAAVTGISNAAVANQTANPITESLVNTTNAPVNVTYLVTPSANGCDNPVPFNYTVTVFPTAVVSSAATDTICSAVAQNYNLASVVAGTTYTWSRAAVTGISNAAVTNQTANPITETLTNTTNAPVNVLYVVTASANGCANPIVFNRTLTVNPTPLVNSAAAGTICSGTAQNYTITSNVAGSTYTWSRGLVAGISNAAVTNQTTNPITETLVNTTNAQVNVPYVIIATANGCSGPSFNYTAIVNPMPTLSSAATGVICSGVAQNYTISSAVAGSSFTWSRAAVTGISNAAVSSQAANPITETLINTTNAPVNVTYVISIAANGCTNPATFNYVVTVNPRPVVTSSGSSIVCSGAAQNYTFTSAVPATTYNWTRSVVPGISNPAANGTSNTITEALTNTTSAPVNVPYNVTPIANGCFNPVPFVYTVTVNPTPDVNSATAGILCSTIPDNYNITGGVSGSTFAWSRAAVAGISNPGVTNQTANPITEALINTTPTTVNVAYVIVPTANGCTGPAFTYNKAIKPTPATPVATNNGPLCVGATLDLGATTNFPAASYSWTGPNGFASTQQNPSITNVAFTTSGVYSVTATVNGCVSPAGTTTVNVSNQPSVANAGTDQIICAGNPINLFGTITGGSSTGIWSATGSGNFTPSPTFLTTTYTPSNADTANGTVVLTLTSTNNGACPASSHSIVLTITDAPTSNAGADQTICSYQTVSLAGAITIAGGGIWSTSGSGTFQPDPTALNAIYRPSTADILRGTVDLTLTTTGTGGCLIARDLMKVSIIPAPVVNAGPDHIILLGNSVTLTPTVTGPVNTYQWTPNIWINAANQPTAIVTPKDDTSYIVTVTGPGGCATSDTVHIMVLFPPQIPNVFSPNGDGVNDTWVIQALSKYPGCTVQIFTRYGQQIFYSEGYQEPWDGTYKGKQMPVGTYYYVIEPKNGVPRFSGYVVILR